MVEQKVASLSLFSLLVQTLQGNQGTRSDVIPRRGTFPGRRGTFPQASRNVLGAERARRGARRNRVKWLTIFRFCFLAFGGAVRLPVVQLPAGTGVPGTGVRRVISYA